MTSFIAADGSGRSTSLIPAVPAASSVTTIAFIWDLPVAGPFMPPADGRSRPPSAPRHRYWRFPHRRILPDSVICQRYSATSPAAATWSGWRSISHEGGRWIWALTTDRNLTAERPRRSSPGTRAVDLTAAIARQKQRAVRHRDCCVPRDALIAASPPCARRRAVALAALVRFERVRVDTRNSVLPGGLASSRGSQRPSGPKRSPVARTCSRPPRPPATLGTHG